MNKIVSFKFFNKSLNTINLGICSILFISLSFSSCKGPEPDSDDNFDRYLMLNDISTNVIIPTFNQLNNSADSLLNLTNQFVASPNEILLNQLQNQWKNTAQLMVQTGIYSFGPSEGLYGTLRENIGTFPPNTSLIESFIENKDTGLQNFNRDTRGLFAIEYLIFDLENNSSKIIQNFSSENRKSYLRAIVKDIANRVKAVTDEWNGNYLYTFVNNSGTDAGSSTSVLYNEWLKSFESIKNFKLGIPLGLRPGQTGLEPLKCEAAYSGYSLILLFYHIEGIKSTFYGSFDRNSPKIGFDDYLKNMPGGNELLSQINKAFDNIGAILNPLLNVRNMRLDLINNISEPYKNLHDELQKSTRYVKSDMSSLLGISITYSSGDGD